MSASQIKSGRWVWHEEDRESKSFNAFCRMLVAVQNLDLWPKAMNTGRGAALRYCHTFGKDEISQ